MHSSDTDFNINLVSAQKVPEEVDEHTLVPEDTVYQNFKKRKSAERIFSTKLKEKVDQMHTQLKANKRNPYRSAIGFTRNK